MLDSTVADWAQWDDTYNFIGSGDTAYIDTNLPDSELADLDVELMLFNNNSGQIVYGKMVDHDSGAEMPIPTSLYSELQVGSHLLSHKDPTDKMTGILSLPEGPMMISSQAIVTSLGEGPIRGTLIMGRRLNENEIAELSNMTQLSISTFQYNAGVSPDDVALARNSLVGV
jgi:sensor domain CHASE-containing protein